MRRIIPPLVEAEIQQAAHYFESKQVGLGREFVEAIEAVLVQIDENPELYQAVFLDVRRAPEDRFHYNIFYIPSDDHYGVIAVVHGARHPRVWQGRVLPRE